MGIFDIFKGKNNKKEEAVYEKQPPNYWEEYSYMQIVPKAKEQRVLDAGFSERLSQIEGVTVKELEK
ncbi:MAG: hypothetical protein IJR45_00540, partial [Firmicutes bacterium]|nr:hypothetical protein [Bacillota bacterium]